MADVGIAFESDSFKAFNKQLSTFVKVSKKVDIGLTSMATSFDGLDGKVSKFSKSFESISRLAGAKNTRGLVEFSSSILKLSNAMKTIQGINIDVKKIDMFTSGMKKLFQAFAGNDMGKLKSFGQAFKNVFTRDFSDKRIDGFLKPLQKFSNIDVSKLKSITNSIIDFAQTFATLSSLNLSSVDLSSVKEAFKELTEIFIGPSSGFFSKIKSLASGNFSKFFSQVMGKKGIIGMLSNVKVGGIQSLKAFSNSLIDFARTFEVLKTIQIDKSRIKNISEAFTGLTKIFTGNGGFFNKIKSKLSGGIFGDKGIISEISKIKDVSKLASFAEAIKRFADTIGKIATISLGSKGVSEFTKAAKDIASTFKVISNDTKKINTKGLEGIARAAKDMGKALAAGLNSTQVTGFAKSGKESAQANIDAANETFQTRSPSRVFIKIGKDVASGLAKGIKTSLSLANNIFKGFVNLAKGTLSRLTSPLRFIKDHFVITFSDIQRGMKSLFRGMVGNMMEFETAFTGVLKTLDTSTIFAEGGQDAVDAFTAGLEQDLLSLTTDADSLVAGLENGFVRLSGIAELAGQLGVDASGVAGFADVIGQLSLATDLTDEAGSFFLAKFTSITGTQNFEQIGSSLVNLGNSLAATESQIAEVAQRIVSAGTAAGLSEEEILGWSAAMRASGLSSEAGSTAFIQFTSRIASSVASGEQAIFAEQLGVTNEEFARLLESNPNSVFTDLIGSIGHLSRTEMIQFEEAAGLTGIRLDQFTQTLALSEENSGTLTNAMQLAKDGMQEFGDTVEEYNALQEEAARRAATSASKVARMRNAFKGLSNTFGKFIQPMFNFIVDKITTMVLGIDAFIKKITDLSGIAQQLGLVQEGQVSSLEEQLELNKELDELEKERAGTFVHDFEVGDTLYDLAIQYGTTVDEILRLNDASLEDFANGMSSVILPMSLVDQELKDITGSSKEAGTGTKGFIDAVKESGGLGLLREQIDGVAEGFRLMVTGDISGGIDALKDSLIGLKSVVRDILTNFLGSGGSSPQPFGEAFDFLEEDTIDVDTASFVDLLLATFDELFGVDLMPVKVFIKDNILLIFGAAFGLLTGSPIGLTIAVSKLLVDMLGDNFGNIEESIAGSPFLSSIYSAADSINTIISDAFGDIGDIFSRGGDGPLSALAESSGLTDNSIGTKIIESLRVIFSGLGETTGELSTIIGTAIFDIIKLGIANIPNITVLLISLGTDFVQGIADSIITPEGGVDIGEAIKTLFGLAFTWLTLSGLISGSGIIASMAGALTTMLSAAVALLNPVTLAIAFGVALAAVLLHEETRNKVFDAVQDLFTSALGFESYDEWLEITSSRIVNAIGGVLNQVLSWLRIAMTDIEITLLSVVNSVTGGFGSHIENLREEKEELALIRDLREDVFSNGDNNTLENFLKAGGNINDIDDSLSDIGSRFGIGTIGNLSEFLQQEIDNLKAQITSGEINIDEALDLLFQINADSDTISALFEGTEFEEEYKQKLTETLNALNINEIFNETEMNFGNVIPEALREQVQNAFEQGYTLEDVDFIYNTEDTDFDFSEIYNNMFNEEEIEATGWEIGNDVIRGLMRKVVEESTPGSEYMTSIENLGTVTEEQLKIAFESHSPSEMTKRIGADLLAGLSLGMVTFMNLLDVPIKMILDKIALINNAFANLAVGMAVVIGQLMILQGLGLTLGEIPVLGGDGRKFGGSVTAGGIYEVLEDNLPFELFKTGDNTFFLPNQNGEIISPLSQSGTIGGQIAASNSLNNSTTISNGGDVHITVPISFESVPAGTSSSEIDALSQTISTSVTNKINDAMRENTLSDRLSQSGRT